MALIGKAADQSDFGQGLFGVAQQFLRLLDTARQDPLVRRRARAVGQRQRIGPATGVAALFTDEGAAAPPVTWKVEVL